MQENEKPVPQPVPQAKPTPTPINEPNTAELEKLAVQQEHPRPDGMNADVAVSEAPPASSGPLPNDEQAYFDQQDRERTGRA